MKAAVRRRPHPAWIGIMVWFAAMSPAGAQQQERKFDSLQMKGVPVVDMPVDADAAAKRLSKAITFATVSNQDRKDFDEKAFTAWHQYLVDQTHHRGQTTI